MKKVAIYSRKSKETDTGESIKNQIEMCKEYFLRKNDSYIFEVFEDEGFSGSNTNRPQFQKMMLMARRGAFDIIACYKVDRIGRNIIDFINTFDELEKNNITLVSVTEGFDPSTPAGRMMMTMIAGFAEMERMNIAQRVSDNMLSLAKLGRWSGGTPPTGYKSIRLPNGDKSAMYLQFIPQWKDKLNFIFANTACGHTVNSTARLLNMPDKTVLNIVNNPVYCKSDYSSRKYLESIGYQVYGEVNNCGYLSYNRRPRSKNGIKLLNDEGKLAAVSIHYAPIESSIWIKANQAVKKRAQQGKPRISQYSFLAHKVKCSCGSYMYLDSGHKRKDGTRTYYFCCARRKSSSKACTGKRINAQFLQEDILEMFENICVNASQELLKTYLDKKPQRDFKDEIKKIKSKIAKNNRQLESFTEKLILLEGSAALIIANKMNNIASENDRLNNQLLAIENQSLIYNIDNDSNNKDINILRQHIETSLSNFHKLSMEEKQIAIDSIIAEIKYNGNGDFEIIFNL